MSATIRVGTLKATITDGVWYSKNVLFKRTCEGASYQVSDAAYEPDPDLTAAMRAALALGGTVVASTTARVRTGRVY